jgi:hypothetical protein
MPCWHCCPPRYGAIGQWFANLEDSGIDISQAREVLREMLGEIRVRPEPDGVPVAEYALNETPLAAAAGGAQIGLVAGA